VGGDGIEGIAGLRPGAAGNFTTVDGGAGGLIAEGGEGSFTTVDGGVGGLTTAEGGAAGLMTAEGTTKGVKGAEGMAVGLIGRGLGGSGIFGTSPEVGFGGTIGPCLGRVMRSVSSVGSDI
jgi:hypothetical protein